MTSQSPTGDGHRSRDTDGERPPDRVGRTGRALPGAELIGLLAFSMALTALGIDVMLPAFGDMRADFGLDPGSNQIAGSVTAYFLGLAAGQLAYGPLADHFGRRPLLYIGYLGYAIGALATAVAPSLALLFLGRFVWGLGAAGPRVVALAIVRDRYEGARMARTMSFVMAVFILVPVVAPTVGAAVTSLTSWRWLFVACAGAVVALAVWALRLPETLAPEHRLPLRFRPLARTAWRVFTTRASLGYAAAMTLLYGAFTSYLASSEMIFDQTFDQADAFPVLFGGLAAVMGASMLASAYLVRRFDPARLVAAVMVGYLVAAGALVVIALVTDGRPPLVAYLAAMAVVLACHAVLLPNLNTLAMATMGAAAGTAASVFGALQVAVGALLGALLDSQFSGTITPLAVGFLAYGAVATVLARWSASAPARRTGTTSPAAPGTSP